MTVPYVTRAEIVAEARSRKGERWQHQTNVRGVACDCIGLVGGTAQALGLPSGKAWAADPATKGYGPIPDAARLLELVARYLVPVVPKDSALPGDILLLKWKAEEPAHFGIVTGLHPLSIVHSFASFPRMVCEHHIESEWRHGIRWRDLILSAWRYRELEWHS